MSVPMIVSVDQAPRPFPRTLAGITRRTGFLRVALLMLAAVTPWGDAAAQVVREGFYIANGRIQTEVLIGNTLYIGGDFTQVGPPTGSGVPTDSATGQPVSGFPEVVGRVRAVASDGAGGWYIGGQFTSVGSEPRSNLAHIGADNTVSSWNPGTNLGGIVNALSVSGTNVYVGGFFFDVGGQSRNGLAAVDATTGAVLGWNPNLSGGGSEVYALAVSGSTLYVGGNFTNIGGQPRSYIAALDSTTGLATSWNPSATSIVRALVVNGSTVYVGGDFFNIGGQTRNAIAALDAASGLATTWNPNAGSASVRALAVNGSTVYAGGTFFNIGGQGRLHLAALDASSGMATPWNPQPNQLVDALLVNGSTVYAAGLFTNIGGQSRNYLAAVDTSSGLATPWNPNASHEALALAVDSGRVYVGGNFNSLGGQPRRSLAALNATTGVVTAWNPGANPSSGTMVVNALSVMGSTVWAGGSFSAQFGGQSRNGLVALDVATGLPTPANPNPNGTIFALAVSSSTVYVGGSFGSIGGQNRIGIAALDPSSGLATPWNPSANAAVQTLAVSGNKVYAGGNITSIGGQPRNGIAALDTASGLATPWNPNVGGGVLSLALSGSTVYVGGQFSSIGVQSRSNIAALDSSTGLATPWNPSSTGAVWAIAPDGGTIYAGGAFNGIGGQTRRRLAALDAGTGLATPWNPDANDIAFALAVGNDVVYAGGQFTTLGGQPGSLAAIEAFCPGVGDVADSSATLDSPEASVTGDFDGDGRLDVAAAVAGGAQVMRNLGSGHFGSQSFESTGGNGRGIAAAHLDHDFVLDLAVSTTTGLHVMLGESTGGVPTGSFGPPVTYPVGPDPAAIGIADFNEDGINDLAVAVTGRDSVKVLIGQGSGGVGLGTFGGLISYAVGIGPQGLVVSDLNADGIWDLAVTNAASNNVSVMLGQGANGVGNGGFGLAVPYSVGSGPRPLVAGDFNEDGLTDLAAGAMSSNQVSVLRGNGNGTFGPAVSYTVSGPVRDLEVADFDADGRADLGAALGAGGMLQYLYGDGVSTQGNGSFLIGPALEVGGYLSTLEFGPFDPVVSEVSPLVARLDRDQLVTLEGGCTSGTAATLELSSPNGGEAWQLGNNVPIRWTRNALVQSVHVEVSRDNGVRWRRIASNRTGMEFQWSVTPPGTSQGRLRIVDASRLTLGDASNGSFSMQPLVDVSPVLPARPSFSLAYPNPSRRAVRFVLSLPVEGVVSVEVFDLAGRRVSTLARGPRAAGEHTLTWDGRVAGGRRAAAGVYFVRALMPGFEVVRRLVRIE